MRRYAPIVSALWLAACVQTVELSHDIEPSRSIPDKSSERAGVVCSDELLRGVVRASHFAIALGEPLCGGLMRSVEATYRAAQRATSPPYAGQYGRVVRFDLESSTLEIQHRNDGAVRVTCSVSVIVERFGRDLKRVSSRAVAGNADVARRDAPEAVVVREAVEAALQEVVDNASALLVAGIDGPRQHLSASEP
ncbi:MAG: hypothetical protein ACHQ6T_03385 [Myxococcota bacterium]